MLLILPVLTRSLTAEHDSGANMISRGGNAGAAVLCLRRLYVYVR
jgi:hypothetical protein